MKKVYKNRRYMYTFVMWYVENSWSICNASEFNSLYLRSVGGVTNYFHETQQIVPMYYVIWPVLPNDQPLLQFIFKP